MLGHENRLSHFENVQMAVGVIFMKTRFAYILSLCVLELVRFQNSSVSVLNFKQDPVPVSIGSSKCLTFGFTVLTVFNFLLEYLKIT